MSTPQKITKLVCLLSNQQQAQEALSDLQTLGLPPHAVSVFGPGVSSATRYQSMSTFQQLNLPTRDLELLSDGLRTGGTVVLVSAPPEFIPLAETVLAKHRLSTPDRSAEADAGLLAASASANGTVISILEEELAGKRQVEQAEVRVYSRVAETPGTEGGL